MTAFTNKLKSATSSAALFVFGVVAAIVTERTGRLGTAIWTHVGFNLTTVVLLLT